MTYRNTDWLQDLSEHYTDSDELDGGQQIVLATF